MRGACARRAETRGADSIMCRSSRSVATPILRAASRPTELGAPAGARLFPARRQPILTRVKHGSRRTALAPTLSAEVRLGQKLTRLFVGDGVSIGPTSDAMLSQRRRRRAK